MRLTRPVAFALVALGALLPLLAAVGFQHLDDMEPCPLCILQRYAYFLTAVFAGLAALLHRVPAARIGAGVLALASALGGLGVAGWQVWHLLFPSQGGRCSFSFMQAVNNLPLGPVLPQVFVGMGDCGQGTFQFLGLDMPEWSLLCLLGLAVAAALALRAPPAR